MSILIDATIAIAFFLLGLWTGQRQLKVPLAEKGCSHRWVYSKNNLNPYGYQWSASLRTCGDCGEEQQKDIDSKWLTVKVGKPT